ncbi:MAG: hypothetical protein EAZ55_11805 [Cytophagales bacterium]|nr:MAG: hypothetical protein EAZ55_11805 [Cytophagales bacterium]
MHLRSFLYILPLCYLLIGCSSERPFQAQKGHLDLSKVSWENGQTYALSGEWRFYWQQLLTPSQIRNAKAKQQTTFYANVPNTWNNTSPKNENITMYGYATYHISLKLPHNKKTLGLFIPKIWNAAKVYVNDSLVYEIGKVGTRYEEYENSILEKLIPLNYSKDAVHLTVQVANFDLFASGLLQNFEIGEYESLLEQKSIQYSFTLLWLGALFIMGLYHLVLYVYRSQNTAPLWVAFICLLISMRLLVFGEHYLYEYLKIHTAFSYAIQNRVYYIATFLLIPITHYYVNALYPHGTNSLRRLNESSKIYVFLASSAILLISPHYFAPFIPLVQGIAFAFLLYPIFIIIRASIKREKESSLQITGILAMLLAGINDAAHSVGITLSGTLELMPFAFAIFLCLQFIVIARRFSRAFREVEHLNTNLEMKVAQRTQEVTEKNIALEDAYDEIVSSVKYASRIQHAILGDAANVLQSFEESFIFNQPRDIVSGDFYWCDTISKDQQSYQILVTADATGHGVPAAFLTLLGSNFIEEIMHKTPFYTQPARILDELDQKIHHLLNKQANVTLNDGMDISVIVIDEKQKIAHVAGAKGRVFLVRNQQLTEYGGGLYPIGAREQFATEKVFPYESIALQENDIFYTFSDGFQDQFGGNNNQKYMKKRFKDFLLSIHRLNFEEQKQALESAFLQWKGNNSQTDDVLVIGFKIKQ